jgi:hypothetical protein
MYGTKVMTLYRSFNSSKEWSKFFINFVSKVLEFMLKTLFYKYNIKTILPGYVCYFYLNKKTFLSVHDLDTRYREITQQIKF